jgi:hypothetical protein
VDNQSRLDIGQTPDQDPVIFQSECGRVCSILTTSPERVANFRHAEVFKEENLKTRTSRYREQNIDSDVITDPTKSECTQWTKIESKARQSKLREL